MRHLGIVHNQMVLVGSCVHATMIAYDRVTIGGVVDRLAQKNLVTREVSPTDRRARVLMLSAEGAKVFDLARPWVERVQEDIVAFLSQEEREAFVVLLSKIAKAGNVRSRAPLRAGVSSAGPR